MKQKIILLVLFAASITSLHAQQISVENAKKNVMSFINKQAGSPSANGKKGVFTKCNAPENLKLAYTSVDEQDAAPLYYVFEPVMSDGYIIASADERVVPILGFSEEGHFDTASLPCFLKSVLDNFEQTIVEARDKDLPPYKSTLTEETDFSPIQPLTTSRWRQGAPYNNYCPIDKETGNRCVAGCVAITMAQLLYYHQWPRQGVGSHSYQWRDTILSANFGETEYRYDKMKDTYYGDETDDNVSTLVYHCGVAADMLYSSGESSARRSDEPLYKYFKYYPINRWDNYHHFDRTISTIPEEYHIGLVYYELSHNRPVEALSQTHSAIIDGYQSGGFIHVNMGWGENWTMYIHIMGLKNGWRDTSGDDVDSERYRVLGMTFPIIPEYQVKEVVDKNVTYAIYDDMAHIVSCAASGDVVIPQNISQQGKEYPVTTICASAFKGNENITSVVLPATVTTITGDSAFYGCTNLKSVVLNGNVKILPDRTFKGCVALTGIDLHGVTRLGDECFFECGLQSLTIPSSVTYIGVLAFYWCNDINSISVEEGNQVFDSRDGCNALIETSTNAVIKGCKNSFLPNGIKEINNYAFQNCGDAFPDIEIPYGVERIGYSAFNNCNIETITIPNTVTSIGTYAFWPEGGYTPYHLKQVTSYIKDPFPIDVSVFEVDYYDTEMGAWGRATAKLHVPNGTLEKYRTTDGWKNFKNIIEGEATDIKGVTTDSSQDDNTLYNVQGQRVNPNYKGVVIKAGKKTLVK